MTKAIIAITSTRAHGARRYREVIERLGGVPRLLYPGGGASPQEMLQGTGGLMLTGGPDVHPSHYGQAPQPGVELELAPERDDMELALLRYALERDMPVLAICRGMQLLNVAFGGTLLQDIPGHTVIEASGHWKSAVHNIYISPGSKLAATLGMGGFFRVNSRHHQGLRDAQRSPRLLGSAYSLDDGIVEALESPGHSWVIGLQCHPERQEEVPKSFSNIFLAFLERASDYTARLSRNGTE